jgi:hypothetical protein
MKVVNSYLISPWAQASAPRGTIPLSVSARNGQIELHALVEWGESVYEMLRVKLHPSFNVISADKPGRFIGSVEHQGVMYHAFDESGMP